MERKNRYIYCMWMNIGKPNTNYADDDNWLLAFYKDDNNKLEAWDDMGVTCVKPYLNTNFWLTKQDIKKVNYKYHIKLDAIPINNFKDFIEQRFGVGEFASTVKYVENTF